MFQSRRGASIRQAQGLWIGAWLPRLRLLGVLLSLLGMTGLLHGGWWVLRDEAIFPLRHVQVAGEMRNLNAADVRRVVRHFLGSAFVTLDIGVLRDTFLLNPWVEQVRIQRLWPDTLRIHVQERRVFGHWGVGEMLDRQGTRFRPVYFRSIQTWPRLSGPDGQEQEVLRAFDEAEERVEQIGLRIMLLEMDERRAWRMRFDNGVEIKLGREQFLTRLQRFVDVYPRVLAQRADTIVTVDMRYVNGFAVRWESDEDRGQQRAGGASGTSTRAAWVDMRRDIEAG